MKTPTDVLLFVPNLIGYFRVVCSIVCFVLMMTYPTMAMEAITLYILSFAGDLFDGWAARKFNQCSDYGALLDMVTDRCSTAGLLFVLGCEAAAKASAMEASEQPTGLSLDQQPIVFQFLLMLDVASHWCQMHATLSANHAGHHKSKESNADKSLLVQWYYEKYWFFGYLCVGAEWTYVCLYVLNHTSVDSWIGWLSLGCLRICLPGCVLKQVVNIAQLQSACFLVAARDAAKHNKDDRNSNSEGTSTKKE